MKRNLLILFIMLLAVSAVNAQEGGDSLEAAIQKVAKPEVLTPKGKAEWRAKRKIAMDEAIAATRKAFPEKTVQNRVMASLRDVISGNNRCYRSDDIQRYVSKDDLKNYDNFISKVPTKDKVKDIYDVQRNKIEDKLLANDEIQNSKTLEKELHEKYKLYEDREVVKVMDVRNREYQGVYRKDRTNFKMVRVGQHVINRIDLPLDEKARFWQSDHDDFVKKELRRITRKNMILAEHESVESLDGKIQFMYLEAGYVSDVTGPQSSIFAVEPQYWMTRKELATMLSKRMMTEHFEKLMKSRGYVQANIGDGPEYVTRNVEAAYKQYLVSVERAKSTWQQSKRKR